MSDKTKKILKVIGIIILMLSFISVNVVYAATKGNIHFCDYSGTRRTLKIVGIILEVIRIVVPLIIIVTAIPALTKSIVSGKQEDLVEWWRIFVKKIIAGLLIFFIPTIINYAINNLVKDKNTGFAQCSTCVLDYKRCTIPTTDPVIYEED